MPILQIFLDTVAGGLQDMDLMFIQSDTYQPGQQEVKSFLNVRIPDSPAIADAIQQASCDLLKGAATSSVVRRLYVDVEIKIRDKQQAVRESTVDSETSDSRDFFVDYAPKFSEDELVIIRDPNQFLPDGETSQGGQTFRGVTDGLFTEADIQEKAPV